MSVTEIKLPNKVRHLCLIFGDQLNADSLLWQDFDPEQDVAWMAEVSNESTTSLSSLTRTAYFLSAMRHFSADLLANNIPLLYSNLRQSDLYELHSFDAVLTSTLSQLQEAGKMPEKVIAVLPGDNRIKVELEAATKQFDIALEWLADQHFLAIPGEFKDWLSGRKNPIMEHWYRHIRKRLNILMTSEGKPVGGEWNYDKQNRKTFGKAGPPQATDATPFELDDISIQVLADIEAGMQLPGNNGLAYWPVTRQQALAVLDEFIEQRLPIFGDYQDAMWQDEPFLYHSRISAALNVKLLSPMEVIQAAEHAYHSGQAPLNAVEGFIRQIAGWREYIRGLYWSYREDWLTMNALDAQQDLPAFFWTGDTKMNCLQQSISQVVDTGYGHHIQRLMVTGLFSLLYGIKPEQIHEWYLAMYVDAVAWVEVPNTLGMSQFADGGIVGTKPYIASGAYIDRMSNYCKHCPYNPKQAEGENACPFTTLYWDFVARHMEFLSSHYRLGMQVRNWLNKPEEMQQAILAKAEQFRKALP